MNSKRDDLYAAPQLAIAGFRFDDAVADIFPDMIQRSVPGYETIIAMTGTLAERYAQDGSWCYDLGCSLGASTLAMARSIQARDCRLVGVDNSPAMLARCRQIVERAGSPIAIDLVCADIADINIADASLVVLNFTLQFIEPDRREALLQHIYRGLRPGGVLVLSEKIHFEHAHHDQLMIELHHSFKRANGYSELEISQKRSALEDVLMPETLDVHRRRLCAAGFDSVDVWFQCFNFASIIAIK